MADTEKTWATRKLGAESSSTRTALVEAAHRLLRDEGYSAITSRRVAAEAGLKPQLVHYYFRSMDDLLLEVLHGAGEQMLRRLTELMQSEKPLRALWEFSSDPTGLNVTSEFTALASRNEAIRDALRHYADRFREMQTEAVERHLKQRGIEPQISPVVVSVLMVSLANTLVREQALGMVMGHAEAEALVEECLRQFEQSGDSDTPILPKRRS